jgi:hypothetical protein
MAAGSDRSGGHLISWAGLCPTNDESPTEPARGLKAHGERRSNRMRKLARAKAIANGVGVGRVSRTHRLSTPVRNCTRDERMPFEIGSQVQVSSHRKLLS